MCIDQSAGIESPQTTTKMYRQLIFIRYQDMWWGKGPSFWWLCRNTRASPLTVYPFLITADSEMMVAFYLLLLCHCMCVCVGMYMTGHTCRSKGNSGSCFSPTTMGVLGLNSSCQAWAASPLTCRATSLAWWIYFKVWVTFQQSSSKNKQQQKQLKKRQINTFLP